MRYLTACAVAGFAGVCLWTATARPRAAGDPLTIATLSSRADLVSGGDVNQRALAGTYLKLPLAAPTSSSTSASR